MEAATGAMEQAALVTPPPGEMPAGGMPEDEIEAGGETPQDGNDS
jgi:hypothetical protein